MPSRGQVVVIDVHLNVTSLTGTWNTRVKTERAIGIEIVRKLQVCNLFLFNFFDLHLDYSTFFSF
jgi:hypothetical protein